MALCGWANFAWSAVAPEKPIANIVFFVNADKGAEFWDSQVAFAQAVSKGLNIKLDVHYMPADARNRFAIADETAKYLDRRATPPDFAIASFWLKGEDKLLKVFEQRRLPFISINSNLTAEKWAEMGEPRAQYKHWLGHMSPDDVHGGFVLAKQLISSATKRAQCADNRCQLNMLALTGHSYSAVAREREAGLKRALKYNKNINLLQTVHANWQQQMAYSQTVQALGRHNRIDLFWAGNDSMAYGVVEGLNHYNLIAGEHALIGSIDWSPRTVDYVKDKQIDFSLGGHFMEAGWSLILLADYASRRDFIDDAGVIVKTRFSILNQTNVDTLGAFLQKPEWDESQFKMLSKRFNPKLKRYHFSANQTIQVAGKKSF